MNCGKALSLPDPLSTGCVVLADVRALYKWHTLLFILATFVFDGEVQAIRQGKVAFSRRRDKWKSCLFVEWWWPTAEANWYRVLISDKAFSYDFSLDKDSRFGITASQPAYAWPPARSLACLLPPPSFISGSDKTMKMKWLGAWGMPFSKASAF